MRASRGMGMTKIKSSAPKKISPPKSAKAFKPPPNLGATGLPGGGGGGGGITGAGGMPPPDMGGGGPPMMKRGGKVKMKRGGKVKKMARGGGMKGKGCG